MILHIFMYNVTSDFSAATPASEGRVNENVQITHDRLITLENRTAMMVKAIIPVLKDFKEKIKSTNKRLTRQYRMMIRAHDRYNTVFRQTHKTFQIHHLVLLMF